MEEETNVEALIKTGEHEAQIENLEEKVEEVKETVENAENKLEWTAEDVSRLYERIEGLEEKVASFLALKEKEVELPVKTEESSEIEEIIEETVKPGGKRKNAIWGIF